MSRWQTSYSRATAEPKSDSQVIGHKFEMGGNVSITYDPNTAIKLGAIGLGPVALGLGGPTRP